MYKVIDICKYIICYCNNKDYAISNLKLQKILYFIQIIFLEKKNELCFEEKIEAWDFGPVVPVAYHYFKQYGASNISGGYVYFNDDSFIRKYDEFDKNIISKDDRKILDHVINKLNVFSASELVKITHEQSPWRNTYVPRRNKLISISELEKFVNSRREI